MIYNFFALPLLIDASWFDLSARSDHVETEDRPTLALADFLHVHDESTDAGVDATVKRAGLRGSKGVRAIVSTVIGSNNADGTVQGTKIRIERSNRLVARVS